jgi:hypothetical protein
LYDSYTASDSLLDYKLYIFTVWLTIIYLFGDQRSRQGSARAFYVSNSLTSYMTETSFYAFFA